MKDPNDTKTAEEMWTIDDEYWSKRDEDFTEEKQEDPYLERGVRREDFAWSGCYNKK